MDEINLLKEMKYNITTEKNNKMDLYIRYYDNEEISISIYSINKIPSVKYELRSNLEEFQKNRFFKIFNNIDELILELDSKIEKTTILEETNLLVLDIPIGLKIINDILLEIKIVEKTPTEKIEELIEYNNKLNEENEKLRNELKANIDNMNDLKLNINQLQTKIQNYENDVPFECSFEDKKINIEKYLLDLKKNNEIKILLKLKNISKIKKWKKGFSLNIKNYLNNNEITIINGKIEEEIFQNSTISKEIIVKVNNLEINDFRKDYEFEICLFDENNNLIGNDSVKFKIQINKFSFNFNEEDYDNIYNDLCHQYNVEDYGIKIEKFKDSTKKFLNDYPDDITKFEFINGIKEKIINSIV